MTRVGDIVQIKPNVRVGRWLVGGYIATVVEVIGGQRNTGVWLERENAFDFPILLRADDVTFLRRREEVTSS